MANTERDFVRVTDNVGRMLLDESNDHQPERGSVIMVGGLTGTAWQRQHSSGQWQSCRGGTPRSWNQLIRRRNVILVLDAPTREEQER